MFNQVVVVGKIEKISNEYIILDDIRGKIIELSIQEPFRNERGVYDSTTHEVFIMEGTYSEIENHLMLENVIGIKGRLSNQKKKLLDTEVNVSIIKLEKISMLTNIPN